MPTIRFRGTPEELRDRLASLADMLAGKVADTSGLVEGIKLRVGMLILSKVKQAFEVKAGGGTDEMGVNWPPLAATTLALRRIVTTKAGIRRIRQKLRKLTPERRAQVREQARRLASFAYRAEWWDIFEGGRERRFALRVLERKRKRRTITEAQYREKRRFILGQRKPGAKVESKLRRQILAGAYALILRDTGRFLNSFSPVLKGGGDQIVNSGPGYIEVGSNVRAPNGVPLAALHGSDRTRKQKKDGSGPVLPRRQIFPDGPWQVPASWWAEIRQLIVETVASREFWMRYLGAKAG